MSSMVNVRHSLHKPIYLLYLFKTFFIIIILSLTSFLTFLYSIIIEDIVKIPLFFILSIPVQSQVQIKELQENELSCHESTDF